MNHPPTGMNSETWKIKSRELNQTLKISLTKSWDSLYAEIDAVRECFLVQKYSYLQKYSYVQKLIINPAVGRKTSLGGFVHFFFRFRRTKLHWKFCKGKKLKKNPDLAPPSGEVKKNENFCFAIWNISYQILNFCISSNYFYSLYRIEAEIQTRS